MKASKQIPQLLTLLFLFALATCFLPRWGAQAYAADIPEPADTYTSERGWEGTLELNSDTTVKFVGVTHENIGQSGYSPAIKIANNATVNLVFEGENVLSGNTAVPDNDSQPGGAGIEVELGSTVNIYGADGSTLKATGGKRCAGIGGIGYDDPELSNDAAGNINIYSGTITAIGGDKGAGIGSGYHSSASAINIYGGDITALGTNCGAGIGSGYGTSGGAMFGAQAGFYNGGNITISGGTVRAAAWHMDFDRFDQYDADSIYGDDYDINCFAAGIGGGFGASSGTIEICGEADVTALGCGGGAGIGTGRGTTTPKNFDMVHADCHVTIGGGAKVVAMAGETRYGNQPANGGAGIGLGRGWFAEDVQKGDVTIKDDANVYACAAAGANGIGAGDAIGQGLAHLKTLSVRDDSTVVAIAGQPEPERTAFDEIVDPGEINVSELTFNAQYFDSAHVSDESNAFFKEDMFPVLINVYAMEREDPLTTFSLQRPASLRVGVHRPDYLYYSEVYYKVKDYLAASGAGVLLTHSAAQWKFANEVQEVNGLIWDRVNIIYHLNGGENAPDNPATILVYGTNVDLTDPSRSGYAFGGWYNDPDFNYGPLTSIYGELYRDKEIWAKWEKEPDSGSDSAAAGGIILPKMTAKGKTGLVVEWQKVAGAQGYDIFLGKCDNEKKLPKKVKTIKGNKTFKWTAKGLKKRTAYKAVVKAWTKKKGKKAYILTSPAMHLYTSGGSSKYTNAKSVTVKKAKVTLAKGKTFRIKAKVNKMNKKKKLMGARHAPKLRYLSSDKKIATVSKKGKIKAVGKGTCKIYVFAVNGVSKAVRVTVK